MLLNLHVKNLAIIDEVEVYFKNGLNILTGETGAGKSIIIGSINIALGGKIPKDIIRKGADSALVELIFQIEDNVTKKALENFGFYPEDGQILISRKLHEGKSISRINGETVPAGIIREISGILIDIHGQHQHQSLLYKSKHLSILDHYTKEQTVQIKKQVAAVFKRYQKIKEEYDSSAIDEEKRLREISFLEYEVAEIENASLKEGEEEEVSDYYRKLSNKNTIMEELGAVYSMTGYETGKAGDFIGRSEKILTKLTEYDDKFVEWNQQLADMESILNDFNREVSDYLSSFDSDEEEYRQLEERLNIIRTLKAKYGNSVSEIKDYLKRSKEKLYQYQDYDTYRSRLRQELKEAGQELEELCRQLSDIRRKKAAELAVRIKDSLVDLNFLDVKFLIEFHRMEKYTNNGYDEVEFLISTNPGEEPKPLNRVASGGELSRIMLAIKSVLAENDAVDTLIFDEIDVGVSGRTAQKVSEKLARIAKAHQILCITHLPQIAAMSDEHYIIEKTAVNDVTKTNIRELSYDESTQELARMLGGAKITDTVLQNAQEMKELAKDTKLF